MSRVRCAVAAMTLATGALGAPPAAAAPVDVQKHYFSASPCSGSFEVRGSIGSGDPTAVPVTRVDAVLTVTCDTSDPTYWASGLVNLTWVPNLAYPVDVWRGYCSAGNLDDSDPSATCSIEHPLPGTYIAHYFVSVIGQPEANEPDCRQDTLRPGYKRCEADVVALVVGV